MPPAGMLRRVSARRGDFLPQGQLRRLFAMRHRPEERNDAAESVFPRGTSGPRARFSARRDGHEGGPSYAQADHENRRDPEGSAEYRGEWGAGRDAGDRKGAERSGKRSVESCLIAAGGNGQPSQEMSAGPALDAVAAFSRPFSRPCPCPRPWTAVSHSFFHALPSSRAACFLFAARLKGFLSDCLPQCALRQRPLLP